MAQTTRIEYTYSGGIDGIKVNVPLDIDADVDLSENTLTASAITVQGMGGISVSGQGPNGGITVTDGVATNFTTTIAPTSMTISRSSYTGSASPTALTISSPSGTGIAIQGGANFALYGSVNTVIGPSQIAISASTPSVWTSSSSPMISINCGNGIALSSLSPIKIALSNNTDGITLNPYGTISIHSTSYPALSIALGAFTTSSTITASGIITANGGLSVASDKTIAVGSATLTSTQLSVNTVSTNAITASSTITVSGSIDVDGGIVVSSGSAITIGSATTLASSYLSTTTVSATTVSATTIDATTLNGTLNNTFSVNLNGSSYSFNNSTSRSTPSFYAPTSGGAYSSTDGFPQILTASSNSAPAWADQSTVNAGSLQQTTSSAIYTAALPTGFKSSIDDVDGIAVTKTFSTTSAYATWAGSDDYDATVIALTPLSEAAVKTADYPAGFTYRSIVGAQTSWGPGWNSSTSSRSSGTVITNWGASTSYGTGSMLYLSDFLPDGITGFGTLTVAVDGWFYQNEGQRRCIDTGADGETQSISGTLAVGTLSTSSISGTVSVSGSITATSFNALSDERLKKDITDYEYHSSILSVPVKEYSYKDSDERTIGFIAQDLQKEYPEMVEEGKDGYLSIRQDRLFYLLLEEVKALKEEIEELKGGK